MTRAAEPGRPRKRWRQRADLTLDRLLRLVRLLVTDERTLVELAEAMGCTVRTIQRALVTLRRAGLTVEREHQPTHAAVFRLRRGDVLEALGLRRGKG